jgi:hypothetical protein
MQSKSSAYLLERYKTIIKEVASDLRLYRGLTQANLAQLRNYKFEHLLVLIDCDFLTFYKAVIKTMELTYSDDELKNIKLDYQYVKLSLSTLPWPPPWLSNVKIIQYDADLKLKHSLTYGGQYLNCGYKYE